MAAGRHGGYRTHEFRDREIGFEFFSRRDRYRGQLDDWDRKREVQDRNRDTKRDDGLIGRDVDGIIAVDERKRKFSPIIWGRDGETQSRGKAGARSPVSLPPPPPLPLEFAPSDPLGRRVKSSEELPCDQEENDDLEPGQIADEEDCGPARSISASRWAVENDRETDDVAEEVQPKRRRTTPEDGRVQWRSPKSTTSSELGEIISREGSEGIKSSSSDDEQEHGGDYMEVDGDLSDQLSDTDSEVEDGEAKTLETGQSPQRSINMLQACRTVDEFEKLNKINEGTYGVVYRARDKKSGEIVALKKVKMEKEREGFPLTSLREINILLSLHHPSIVDVKEVVIGSNLDSIFMVMEYMEHDLKGLMEMMKYPFSQSEVKCLMLQLLEGVKFLHDNWVLHRDLKTSNVLLNNCGELKICDFGLSRQYGSPSKPYTHLVVTLWYRAPELLLGAKEYSTAIDMWSLGCIMAELLAKEPLFSGKTEFDQLDKIFKTLGTPSERIWPGFSKLPGAKVNFVKQQYNTLRKKFPPTPFSGRPILSEAGFDLLSKLLTYDAEKRISAEDALKHEWFREVPLPKSKEFMPTFPSQHLQDRRLQRS